MCMPSMQPHIRMNGMSPQQCKTRKDKTRHIFLRSTNKKNIKYIQVVMYDSYCGGNEGSSITLNIYRSLCTIVIVVEMRGAA